jgi:putative ABC transport system permease protein
MRQVLGAARRDVLRLLLTDGLGLIALGTVLGLVGSFLVTSALNTLLFGVSAHDPGIFAAIDLLLLAVTGVACLLPARPRHAYLSSRGVEG